MARSGKASLMERPGTEVLMALNSPPVSVGLQNLINAPATLAPVGAGVGGGSTTSMSSTNDVTVNVDASGNADPAAVGTATAESVRAVMAEENRAALRAVQVVSGG